jgi:hypothetical protein
MLMGGIVGLWTLAVAPEYITFSFYVGLFAGLFPDLDMVLEHRRSFHRPFQYILFTVAAGTLTFFYFNQWTVMIFTFIASINLHSLSDILSSGATVEPFKEENNKGVYNHIREEWIEPRRLIIMGSMSDIMLSIGMGAIIVGFTGTTFLSIITGVTLYGVFHFMTINKKADQLTPEGYDQALDRAQEIIDPTEE